jgi:tetratricopeptide (TPR) repeat protein
MKSDFAEFDFKSQNGLDVDITPPGEWMLANLGIDLAAPEFREISPYKRAHYRAVKNWLTRYKPKPEASNLEKVRGYLEAFHHLCEVEDWERASKIIEINLDTPNNTELHNPLITWGYYREVIDLYSRLLGNLDPASDAVCFLGLGKAYHYLGNYDQAISYYKESLSRMLKIGYSLGVGKVLGSMGNTYLAIKEYDLAISCYEECFEYCDRALSIATELDIPLAKELSGIEGTITERTNITCEVSLSNRRCNSHIPQND